MERALLITLPALFLLLLPMRASAAGNGGLQITPPRQFLTADAGSSTRSKFTVANLTDKSMHVTFNAQQFSVADYTYDYTFNQPDNDWLRLGINEVTLESGQKRDIPFVLTVPTDGKPGGYYYTLLASANLASQGLGGTIQAADLLYATVNGELTRTSHLQGNSIKRVTFGREIPFTLQPINTGNVHQFVYVNGKLQGPTARPEATSGTHMLLPGKIRNLTGSIPSPILPGIYRATYGYKTDTDQTITASAWVVYIPPWSIAVLLGIILILGKFLPRRKSKSPNQPKAT